MYQKCEWLNENKFAYEIHQVNVLPEVNLHRYDMVLEADRISQLDLRIFFFEKRSTHLQIQVEVQ